MMQAGFSHRNKADPHAQASYIGVALLGFGVVIRWGASLPPNVSFRKTSFLRASFIWLRGG